MRKKVAAKAAKALPLEVTVVYSEEDRDDSPAEESLEEGEEEIPSDEEDVEGKIDGPPSSKKMTGEKTNPLDEVAGERRRREVQRLAEMGPVIDPQSQKDQAILGSGNISHLMEGNRLRRLVNYTIKDSIHRDTII